MISLKIWVAPGVLLLDTTGVFTQLMQFGLREGFKPPVPPKSQVMETTPSHRAPFPLHFKNVRRHSAFFRTPAKKWFPSKMFYILVVCGHRWRPPKVIGRKRCSTSTINAWAMWCFDIENYLVQAGLLDSHQHERKVGDAPTVRTGSHRVGATQSITERHLRRFIRRLHEARTLAWRRMRIPHTLYKKLLGTNCPASEQEAVRAHAWGLAHQIATVRLRQLQDAHRNDALQKWRARMRDLPQACQWLRKEEAAPLAFKDVDHSILTSP